MKRLNIILCLLAMLAIQACIPKYTLNGASIDYSVYRTISFGDFPIRAALVYPPLQQTFENTMTDMIGQQTRLRVIDNANSDLQDVPADEHMRPTWKHRMANWAVVRFFMKPLATFDYMLRMMG